MLQEVGSEEPVLSKAKSYIKQHKNDAIVNYSLKPL